jgi:creatinine amidohydrolase
MKKTTASLSSLNFSDVKAAKPNLAILPWGATEAHNQHLPYAADVTQAQIITDYSASLAKSKGAKVVVLPAIPFGNNAQQLDQYCTIHLSTTTAYSILKDVVSSLTKQGIDKLIISNSHGGNNFKPLIRDLQNEFRILIILADLCLMIPDKVKEIFDEPGDHAGELETSLMMYISEEEIKLNKAGDGSRKAFVIKSLNSPGVWTPRPWKASHPDLGSGNPANASIKKGEKYFFALCNEFAKIILDVANAKKGGLPYI